MSYEDELKKQCFTESGPYLRPFQPNVNWKTAQIFLIGSNPATPLRNEFSVFDEYWNSLTQNVEIFDRQYRLKHEGGTTKTTGWLHDFVNQLNLKGINCLVTNICWYPTNRFNQVPKEIKKENEGSLLKLISYVNPKVLFFQGSEAEKFGKKFFSERVDRLEEPDKQDVVVDEKLLLAYHHFSGMGLPRGAQFNPSTDLPKFVQQICGYLKKCK